MIPKKPVPGLDPGMETGFRKRSCSSIIPELDFDSIGTGKASRRGRSGVNPVTFSFRCRMIVSEHRVALLVALLRIML
jgi:hypothetical protein